MKLQEKSVFVHKTLALRFNRENGGCIFLEDILKIDTIGEGCFDNLYTGYDAIVFMNNIEDSII